MAALIQFRAVENYKGCRRGVSENFPLYFREWIPIQNMMNDFIINSHFVTNWLFYREQITKPTGKILGTPNIRIIFSRRLKLLSKVLKNIQFLEIYLSIKRSIDDMICYRTCRTSYLTKTIGKQVINRFYETSQDLS